MILKGVIHKFGDHIDTDAIIPTKFLGHTEPEWLAEGCFSNLSPGFAKGVRPGDLIFAGENFGCGSSREHAPIAIKATEIACVVAASFSRLFYRSAINIGLPVVTCPEAIEYAVAGEEAEVNFSTGVLIVGGRRFAIPQFPPQVATIVQAGGLVPFMKKRLKTQTGAGDKA
jgi:3-isopropylmalate/(R)-2-methylmalate dehydratase small subunit